MLTRSLLPLWASPSLETYLIKYLMFVTFRNSSSAFTEPFVYNNSPPWHSTSDRIAAAGFSSCRRHLPILMIGVANNMLSTYSKFQERAFLDFTGYSNHHCNLRGDNRTLMHSGLDWKPSCHTDAILNAAFCVLVNHLGCCALFGNVVCFKPTK